MDYSIVLPVVGVCAVFLFLFHRWSSKYHRKTWNAVADSMGLEVFDDTSALELTIGGQFEGITVSAQTIQEGQGRNETFYLLTSARVPATLPSDLTIYHRKYYETQAEFPNIPHIKLGDKELDAKFIFFAQRPRRLRELVRTPAVKRRLLLTYERCPAFRVENNEVSIKVHDFHITQFKLARNLHLSIDLARTLQEASSTHALPPPSGQDSLQPAQPAAQPVRAPKDSDGWW